MRLEIARPSPVPPNFRVIDASACVNSSKIDAEMAGLDADTGVAHDEPHAALTRGRGFGDRGHHDFTLRRELDRVADEIRQDLAESRRIALEHVRHVRRDLGQELDRAVDDTNGEQAGGRLDQIPEVERDALQRDLLGLDLRVVEHIVQQ